MHLLHFMTDTVVQKKNVIKEGSLEIKLIQESAQHIAQVKLWNTWLDFIYKWF